MTPSMNAPDARLLILQHMHDPKSIQHTAQALLSQAPDYLTQMLRAGHADNRPEEELRALFDLSPDAVLDRAEPFWGMLKAEMNRRKITIPNIKEVPVQLLSAEARALVEEIAASSSPRFPLAFYDIQAARAARAGAGHPLLPLAWVDMCRFLPGFQLSRLKMFAPDDPSLSDPTVQVQKKMTIFARSGGDRLHAYGSSGRCYVLSLQAATLGKVKEAVTFTNFSEYLTVVLPKVLPKAKLSPVPAVEKPGTVASLDPQPTPTPDVVAAPAMPVPEAAPAVVEDVSIEPPAAATESLPSDTPGAPVPADPDPHVEAVAPTLEPSIPVEEVSASSPRMAPDVHGPEMVVPSSGLADISSRAAAAPPGDSSSVHRPAPVVLDAPEGGSPPVKETLDAAQPFDLSAENPVDLGAAHPVEIPFVPVDTAPPVEVHAPQLPVDSGVVPETHAAPAHPDVSHAPVEVRDIYPGLREADVSRDPLLAATAEPEVLLPNAETTGHAESYVHALDLAVQAPAEDTGWPNLPQPSKDAESHAQAGLDDMPAKPAADAVPGHSPNVHPTSDNPDVAPAVQEPRVEKAPDPSVLPHVSAPVLPEEDAWPDAPPEVSAPPVVPVVEDVSSASPDLVVITLEDDRLNQASGPEIELEVDPDPSRLELAVLEEPQTAPVLLSTQQRRQLRSEQIIYATLRMTPNPAIAPVPDDDAINIRVPGQIAMRARCLLSVIAWASGFRLEQEARGGGVPQELIEETLGEGMQRRLTRMEQLFLETDPPGTRERHAVAWRIEALAVLLRVIGVMPRLPSPAEEVNPETVFNLAFEALIRRNEKPGLALGESGLLDLLDLYRRLHGLVQEKGQIGIQTDVLRERRHALEWLITEADSKSLAWDEVDLVIPMRPGA